MTLFDRYIAVDWSAANSPRVGKDSIWVADAGPGESVVSVNPPTRAEAAALLSAKLQAARQRGERVAVGFDFAFGYPAGGALAIGGKRDWQALWSALSGAIADGPGNRSNRFEIANTLNRDIGQPLYWGHPPHHRYVNLTPTRPDHGYPWVREMRLVEKRARGAQSVWKLNGAGSVGGQSLLGIPRLQALRAEFPEAAVWPFETGFADHLAPITLIEIFPSLFPLSGTITPRDREQVEVTVRRFRDLDASGRLGEFLSAPADLTEAEARIALEEEGWIAGVGHDGLLTLPLTPPGATDYLRDPAQIYAQSFAAIRAETDLTDIPTGLEDVVVRMVHACGMTDIVPEIRWGGDVVAQAEFALINGAPVFCDCEAVRAGISRKYLPVHTELLVTLNDPPVPDLAAKLGTTRSAAAVELWRDRLGGAVVVIGNAPTALYHLLELLDAGAPKPAAIIATPVGFVGAAESKALLALDLHQVPFLTLLGRRGGSAMASAALNAIARGIRA